MSFSMDCKEVGDVANKIWSSAYSIRNNLSSSIENKPSMSVLMLVTISFINIMKSKDELGSPCFTPKCEWMLFDNLLLCLMAERTTEYIDLIAFVILELIFSDNIFCQRNIWLILS